MHKILYQGVAYTCRKGETVLDALLRANISIPFSCRNGSCHTCMLQAKSGTLTAKSQESLKKSLIDKSYFLPCKCIPRSDLTVKQARQEDLYSRGFVVNKKMLNDSICRILLETAVPIYYHAGQFINIRRPDGLVRSYSLASMPKQDAYLELHIKRYSDGEMSQWLIDDVELNECIEFHGPLGDCYYRNDITEKNILLIGTGTGLAPLQGVVRDALASSHQAEIYLYHGSSTASGIYNRQILTEIAENSSNFKFMTCVSQEDAGNHIYGRADQTAFQQHRDLSGWIVYLAGNANMVYSALENAVQFGAAIDNIFADPFECGEVPVDSIPSAKVDEIKCESTTIDQSSCDSLPDDPDYPPPDLEMWQALDDGKLLTTILKDFYLQVYEDDKLKGFFKDFTKDRAIEKQYSFLRKVFTHDDVYFGDRPRNAHHWMVISNDLFDYREALMESCLRKYGLAEHLIKRWLTMEEAYRGVIVKSQAWPKLVGGISFPLEGFEEITLEYGALCDGCASEVDVGETVTYHLRLGTVYCCACSSSAEAS